jgi:signal peptidase I
MRFYVPTTSMLPTLRPGDALIVERGAAAEVAPGALVVIRNGNIWVVHRLIHRKANGGNVYLQTKGDNQLNADPGFDGAAPMGVARSILREENKIDLFSWRARTGGRILAWISGAQAGWSAPAPGRFRRLILEGMRRGISVLSRLVYHP